MPPAVAAAAIAAGATIGTGAMASRAQSGASRRASDVTERSNRAAEEEARAQREEDRRRWEAEQQHNAQVFAAQEEERAYRRQQDEYQQQLLREREARAAPYRQMSAAALGNLGQMLGIDLGGSPLAQNLTAPRTAPPAPPGGPGGGPQPMWHGKPVSEMFGPDARLAPSGPLRQPMRDNPRYTLGDMTGLRRMA